MNNEIKKAIRNKEKSHKIREWWDRNGYIVLRIILFSLWIGIILKEKITKYLNNRQVWSDARTDAILNYYVPQYADWDKEDKCFYFFDNGYGWSIATKKIIKRKDRRYWKYHIGHYGGRIRSYLIKSFKLEGFEKEIVNPKEANCYGGATEIIFRMIEK